MPHACFALNIRFYEHKAGRPVVNTAPSAEFDRELVNKVLHGRLYRLGQFGILAAIPVSLATLFVDWLIVPEKIALIIFLKGMLVIAPLTLAYFLPRHRSRTRNVLIGLALCTMGGIITVTGGWAATPDQRIHGFGAILALTMAMPLLPFSARESTVFLLAYVALFVTILSLIFPDVADNLKMFAILGVAGTGAWLTSLHLWSLRQQNARLTASLQRHLRREQSANRKLADLSRRDPLTGIANRRGFEREFEQLVASKRNDTAHALLVMDLDEFKRINDEHGHEVGDACLQMVGSRLDEFARETDGIAARFGGEEFVLALPVTGATQASELAEQLRREIERLPKQHEGLPPCTVSTGIALANDNEEADFPALFRRADKALYRAKKGGRNRCEMG